MASTNLPAIPSLTQRLGPWHATLLFSIFTIQIGDGIESLLRLDRLLSSQSAESSGTDLSTAVIGRTASRSASKRLFVTQNGRLGNDPLAEQPGDVIILPLGGQLPLVIRPCGSKYGLVGECYLHGFIDGESLIAARKSSDLNYDGSDTSWLQRLHEYLIPFPMQDFELV
jgi:hypothetical protein